MSSVALVEETTLVIAMLFTRQSPSLCRFTWRVVAERDPALNSSIALDSRFSYLYYTGGFMPSFSQILLEISPYLTFS